MLRHVFACTLFCVASATVDAAAIGGLGSSSSSIYDADYNSGYDAGYPIGYDNGYVVGGKRGRVEGAVDGETDGYNDGYEETYQPSYDSAYAESYPIAYNEAYTPAYDAAHPTGLEDGYRYIVELAATQQLFAVTPNGYVTLASWDYVGSFGMQTGMKGLPRPTGSVFLSYGGLLQANDTYDPEEGALHYQRGYNVGEADGFINGDADGYEATYGAAYDAAYAPALEVGREEGVVEGLLNGAADGTEEGAETGFLDGDAHGYADGLDAGIEIAWGELVWADAGQISLDGLKLQATQYFTLARNAVPEPSGVVMLASVGVVGLARRR